MADKGLICLPAGPTGSTGDNRSLIAVALGLKRRGYQVLLTGDIAFEGMALRAGIAPSEWFSSSLVPQSFWLRTEAGQRGLWGEPPRRRDRVLRQELVKHWVDRRERFWRHVGGPDSPRLAAIVGGAPAMNLIVQATVTCPKIVSSVTPCAPSRHFTFAPPDLPFMARLRARRRYRATNAAQGRALREEIFHLVGMSPTFFPRPDDWLPNMQLTGMTDVHVEQSWAPAEPLRDFMEQGTPPVFVGFGNHAVFFGERGQQRVREIVDGCRRAGFRVLIQCPDLSRSLAADDVFLLEGPVSHASLFPRCAAILHHGGYGTLYAALVAGRPSVIYPFQTDQFLMAACAGEAGVAQGFTGRLRDVTADRVAADLKTVFARGCDGRAARAGAAFAREDGVAVQVDAIESIIAHARAGGRPLDWRMPVEAAAAAARAS